MTGIAYRPARLDEAAAILAVLVVLLMQRWFVRGLVEAEK